MSAPYHSLISIILHGSTFNVYSRIYSLVQSLRTMHWMRIRKCMLWNVHDVFEIILMEHSTTLLKSVITDSRPDPYAYTYIIWVSYMDIAYIRAKIDWWVILSLCSINIHCAVCLVKQRPTSVHNLNIDIFHIRRYMVPNRWYHYEAAQTVYGMNNYQMYVETRQRNL